MPALRPTILVVDSFRQLHELYRHILTRSGLDVIVSATGAEALSLYRAMHGSIAAVVCDLNVSDMDGFAILTALRRIDPAVVCVLLNDGSLCISDSALERFGCQAILRKPLQIRNMGNTLLHILSLEPVTG